MKKMRLFYAVAMALFTLTFSSCDEDALQSLTGGGDDTVAALKEALTIGAQVASNKLGAENGYLNDEKVRIAMPEELQTMLELANTDAGKTFLSAVGADAFVGKTLKVVCDEAVELAKKYSTDDSSSFVNGILAKVIVENGLK